jgi:DNA-binding GntR family transcriptional regulator
METRATLMDPAGWVAEAAPRLQTAADHVADQLREAITRGALLAGAPLRQEELATRFGLSRMPVRDALRRLEAEGIVSIHPTRGAFVAKMDPAEIRDIYAVRELLEIEALRLSIPSLDAAKLDEAAAKLDEIDRELDVGRWGTLNRAFHLALYSACGNGRLMGLIDAQLSASDRYVRVLLSKLNYRVRSQSEHRALLGFCRARFEAEAVAELRRHLRDGAKRLADAIT